MKCQSEQGPVDGSGTANYLARWIDSDTLGIGAAYDNGTNVGIGTTSPSSLLTVVDSGGTGLEFIPQDAYNRNIIFSYKRSASTYKQLVLSANDFSFVTGGVNDRMVIKNDGKVGIGTTSPATILDLDDGTLSDIRIRGNATTDVRFAGIAFYNTAGSDTVAAVNVDRDGANDAGALTFDTQPAGGGNTERMRITSAGNVGIGTTSPNQLIDVASSGTDTSAPTIRITNTANNNASGWNGKVSHALEFYSSDPSRVGLASSIKSIAGTDKGGVLTGNITFNTADWPSAGIYERMRITDDGNVGIGTTSPSANLHVEGATQVKGANSWAGIDTQNGAIYMSDVGQGLLGNLGSNYARPLISTASQTIIIGSSGTSAIRNIKYQAGNGSGVDSEHNFFTSGNNIRLHIATDGKVGIGADTPQRKLDVTLSGNSGVDASFGGLISVGEYQGIHFGYSETTNNLYRKSAIVFERTDSTSNNAQGKIHILNGPQTGSASATLSDAKLTIAENGNVGIGTTSPQAKLQVSGGIQMADDTDTASAAKVGTMRYRTATNEPVAVTGTELVTNGNFATDTNWTKNTGITISGGTANFTSVAGQYLSQDINFTNSAKYLIRFEITVQTSGVLTVFLGAGNNVGSISGVGQKQIVATGSTNLDDKLYFGNNFTGSIDNVSVIEVTEEDASYADMCMQTAASTYEWVNIVRNSY